MKPFKILMLTAALSIAMNFGCEKKIEKSAQIIDRANFLLGDWSGEVEGGKMTESWSKRSDSIYDGIAMYIKGKDTLHFETSALTQNVEDLIYSVTVVDQNNGMPVSFRLTKADSVSLVFENPAHDFPKKISYRVINKDSLFITISGDEVGKNSTESYGLGRK